MRLPVLALLLAVIPYSAGSADDPIQDETIQEETNQEETNPVFGVWLTDGGKSKTHVSKCDEGLCSEIIWLEESLNSEGAPLTDDINPNPDEKGRPIIGIKILDNLIQTERYEWEGQIYNPEDGNTYLAYVTLIKPDVLRVKGCLSMGWPCRSKFWRKLDEEPPAQPELHIADAASRPQLLTEPQVSTQLQTLSESQPETQEMRTAADKAGTTTGADQPSTARPVTTQGLTGPVNSPQTLRSIMPLQRTPESASLEESPPQAAAAPAAPAPSAPLAAPKPSRGETGWLTEQIPAEPPRQSDAARAQIASAKPRKQAVLAPPPAVPSLLQRAVPQPRPMAALPRNPVKAGGVDSRRYLVQVAARQSESEAMAAFHELRQRYPRLFANARPVIKRVNLGDLGVWYRVRVGPISSKASALAFCNRLKFAGSDCFINRQ